MGKKKQIKRLKELSNMVGEIFNLINSEICSDCPEAVHMGKIVEKVGDNNRGLFSKEAGCCSKCAEEKGYFQTAEVMDRGKVIVHKQFLRLTKKYGFDKKYGFFDNKNKECRLPRWKRSATCLYYYCPNIEEKIDWMKLRKTIHKIKDIRWNYGWII